MERDIQEFLCANLTEIFNQSLDLIASEYPVPFGRGDILAKDAEGNYVVIEVKLGTLSRDAIGQLQSYMGAIESEFPNSFVRGILIASGLDAGADAALRFTRNIVVYSYEINFSFTKHCQSPSTYEEWLQNKIDKRSNSLIWLPSGAR